MKCLRLWCFELKADTKWKLAFSLLFLALVVTFVGGVYAAGRIDEWIYAHSASMEEIASYRLKIGGTAMTSQFFVAVLFLFWLQRDEKK